MEERTLKLSLKQAREWYYGENETLKELSLKVFKEKELAPSLWELCHKTNTRYIIGTCSDKMYEELNSICTLSIIADYLNKDWVRVSGNTGYFIKDFDLYNKYKKTKDKDLIKYIIGHHSGVKYPGLVYFKSEEDALKALNLLDILTSRVVY